MKPGKDKKGIQPEGKHYSAYIPQQPNVMNIRDQVNEAFVTSGKQGSPDSSTTRNLINKGSNKFHIIITEYSPCLSDNLLLIALAS